MTVKISVARFREAIRCYEGYCLDCGEFTRETTEPDANGYDCPVCEGRKVVGAENLLFTPGIEITEEPQPGRILRDAIKKSPPVETPKPVPEEEPEAQSLKDAVALGYLDAAQAQCLRDFVQASVKTPKPVLKANVRGGDGKLTQVQYTKRFVASGFTFFLHGKRGAWTVSSWDCGLKLGDFPTVKAGIDKAKSLTPRDIVNVQGAVSLHKGANPPVKKGDKS